ncbi:MAG: nucleotide pyrophosphohydrolase [Oscillospiraceae bacterium]|nr:nucleotide pyrophosphohydrolase [Oscillospiraceae bacterium]
MGDKTTTIAEIRESIRSFVSKRGWENNNPLNLVMALSVETAELMEIFQWLSTNETDSIKDNHKELEHLQEEIADIFWYLMRICDHFNVDLAAAVEDKKMKNELKYPEPNKHYIQVT